MKLTDFRFTFFHKSRRRRKVGHSIAGMLE